MVAELARGEGGLTGDQELLLERCGYQPNAEQRRILESDKRFVLVAGGEQARKHLHVDTPIATPAGWTRMGDLTVGDYVFDDAGLPVRVEWVSEAERLDAYRLSFDNGDEIIASGSHPWLVRNYNARKHEHPAKVRTTEEMLEQGTVRLAPRNRRPFANWSIASPEPLQFSDATFPIDPYVLGAWLGDGHSDGANITTVDDDVLVNLAWAGVDVRPTAVESLYGLGGAPREGGVDTIESKQASLRPLLRSLDVLKNKHIPVSYLRGSEPQRQALLQGLMDTDGTIDKRGRTSFTTTKKVLKDGFVELLSTFGISFRVNERRAKLYGKDCGPVWNVHFQTRMNVFRLGRKARRQKAHRVSSRSDNIYIGSIEPVGSQMVRCIGVQNDSHLYLAGRTMIPTHNSNSAALKLLISLLQTDGRGLYWLVGAAYSETAREFEYIVEMTEAVGFKPKASKRVDPGTIVLGDGTRIETKSGSDPRRLSRDAPNGIIGCEASQLDLQTFERIMGRAAPKRGWVFLSGTFEKDTTGWYQQLWKAWNSGYQDRQSFSIPSWTNEALYPGGRQDPEILRLERESSDDFFMERIEGVPVPPQGLVFGEFRPDLHVKDVRFDADEPVYIWIDPGYAGAYAVEAVQVVGEELRVFDEVYETGLTTEDIILVCQKRYWWQNVEFGAIDIAARQHQAMPAPVEVWLSRTGLYLVTNKVGINDGIERMKVMLKPDPITGVPRIVISPNCRGLLSELGAHVSPITSQMAPYVWKTDRSGNVVGTVPEDKNNHAVKSLIYGMWDRYGPTGAAGSRKHIPVRNWNKLVKA